MVISKALASKIEEYGAPQILRLIRSWKRRRARDRARYEDKKKQLESITG